MRKYDRTFVSKGLFSSCLRYLQQNSSDEMSDWKIHSVLASALRLWTVDHVVARELPVPCYRKHATFLGFAATRPALGTVRSVHPPSLRPRKCPSYRCKFQTRYLRLTVPPCDLTWQQ